MSEFLLIYFLPISLAFIMFGMGMTLTTHSFTTVFKYPKAIFIGILNQVVILPIIAFFLAFIFNLDTTLAIGLMVLAACPGGPTSNLITQICKGNIALSVSLTAIINLTSMITINIVVPIALKYYGTTTTRIELPLIDTGLRIMTITLIPICLGMLVRKLNSDFAIKMEKAMKITSTSIFVLIFIGIIKTNLDTLEIAIKQVGHITLILNILIIITGFFIAKVAKLNYKDAIAIGIDGGIQNGTLAFVICTTILHNFEMSIPTAAYSIWMYISGFFLMWMLRNKKSV